MKGIAGFYYVDVEESAFMSAKQKEFSERKARNRSSEILWKSRFWMKWKNRKYDPDSAAKK